MIKRRSNVLPLRSNDRPFFSFPENALRIDAHMQSILQKRPQRKLRHTLAAACSIGPRAHDEDAPLEIPFLLFPLELQSLSFSLHICLAPFKLRCRLQ